MAIDIEQQTIKNLQPAANEIKFLSLTEKMAITGAIFCLLERARAGENVKQFLIKEGESESIHFARCIDCLATLKRRELRVLLQNLPWL